MSSDFSFAPELQRERSLSLPEDTPPSSTDRKVSEDFTGKDPYEPLQSKEHIRLLRLEPPVASSTQNIPVISATLREVNLFAIGESPCPPYKALSYEWGLPPSNPSDARTMLLDNHSIHIRRNLHDALHSILHNHEKLYGTSPLYLWVDALCINQLDNREKGHQVQLMKNIYKGAKMVIVWLGMGTACTDEAMELLKIEERDLDQVWILQEFVMARDYVVLCNRLFVTKEYFERGLSIADWWSRSGPRGMTDTGSLGDWSAYDIAYGAPLAIIALRSLLAISSGPTLYNWLATVYIYGFKATDPRNYVFALLGISGDGAEIVPDYELATSEVYCMAISIMSTDEGMIASALVDIRFDLDLADLMGISRKRASRLENKLA
ncbi:heterokaryon incompatibility protein-domain-containing protein [Neurospora crassa]|nr:heterokaryon incompatibility protein-domain-containing protein [Neurospora crassa]